MIDRETNDAFDELFVGSDPPESVAEAMSRLSADLRKQVANDDDARRNLAELVWMSKALRGSSPRPSISFADRTADAAFRSSSPSTAASWRFAITGTIIAASVLLAIGVFVSLPKSDQMVRRGEREGVTIEPQKSNVEAPTLALLDQVKKIMPKFPPEMPIGRVDMALASAPETTSLAAAITAPAGKLADVGKTLDKETKPIRDSVREAFAFLGDFPPREKRSL